MSLNKILIILPSIVFLIILFFHLRKRKRLKYKNNLYKRFGLKKENELNIEKVIDYYRETKEIENKRDSIDSITWNDLDMDDVFLELDHTISTIGKEYLYKEMHYIDSLHIDTRKKLYNIFLNSKFITREVMYKLSLLRNAEYNGVIEYIKNIDEKLGNTFFINIFSYLPYLVIILGFFNLQISILLGIVVIVVNTVIHYNTKLRMQGRLQALSYFVKIIKTYKEISQIGGNTDLQKEFKNLNDSKIKVLNPFNKMLNKYISNDIFVSSTNQSQVFMEYLKIIFLLDIKNYNQSVDIIKENREAAFKLVENLCEIDLSLSIASYLKIIKDDNYSFSLVGETLNFKDLTHPLVDDCIPNSFNETNGLNVLITGSNASGKSTFIKSVALALVFSQSFGFSNSNKFTYKPGSVMSSMAIKDNIKTKESYYLKEIKSLKRILDYTLDSFSYVFIDEILRGTNTLERISASATVLKHLKILKNFSMVATHDIELTQILKDDYINYHFSEYYDKDDIKFDYLLKEGASNTKNAINLLSILKYDEEIIKEARQRVEQFEKTNSWF